MILSTVPDNVVLGGSTIREASSFSSAIFALLVMRGLENSSFTLASNAALDCFLSFLLSIRRCCHSRGNDSVPFRTSPFRGWELGVIPGFAFLSSGMIRT